MSTDWANALRFAVIRLGLSPEAFWRLTLLEWRVLAGAAGTGAGALNRAGLEDLLAQHPGLRRKEITA